MYKKDFDRWNSIKKGIDTTKEPLFFHEGEIWWVSIGVNVGFEIDGKNDTFSRPVIVLRKYNKLSFLALPLTTSATQNAWKLPIGTVAGKQAFAVMSQIRNIDSHRLYQKITSMKPEQFRRVRAETLRRNIA
jgi:mRNA-degrading endonuclease toxin of MazEF toxin-antitoxin module